MYVRQYSTIEKRVKPSLRFYLYSANYRWDVSEMILSHNWSGDINIPNESFDLDIWNRMLSNDNRRIPFTEGLMMRVMLVTGSTEKELFRGVIISRSLSSKGEESVKVVDYNWYLQQNEVTKSFRKRRADQIIAELCKMAGVSVGAMANTGYVFAELEFIDKSIWAVIKTVLTETYLKTGKRYRVRSEAGKLTLREVTLSTSRILIERGNNLISGSRDISIESVKTAVIMTGGENDSIRQSKTDSEAKKKYGTLTTIEQNSELKTASAVGAAATALLNKLKKPSDNISVEALSDFAIYAGTLIEVYDSFTGASGEYYVTSHSHSNRDTMSLELSKTLDLEMIRYEAPKDENDKTKDANGKGTNLKYTAGYTATAYDPKLGGINGSGDYKTTASGTKWAYNRTIAVDPKVIPYGSVVHLYVPGFPQYSGIYLAEDTGGAIKGKRIDVLIKGKDATKKFGKRQIQVAIIEKGTGKADARNKVAKWSSLKSAYSKKITVSSSKKGKTVRDDIVSMARSYKGKLKYKFGGKNIGSGAGDCSGFTYAIYKKQGIDIGHGTTSQVTKGKKMAKSAALPGDLVFFKGTYRAGVSHVGIVTTPGNCVSLTSSGCVEHSYTSGYWGQHFLQINRVLN